MATNFVAKFFEIGRLHPHSARWRSEVDCRIAISISEDELAMISLHCKEILRFGPVTPVFLTLECVLYTERRSLLGLV